MQSRCRVKALNLEAWSLLVFLPRAQEAPPGPHWETGIFWAFAQGIP